MKTKSEKDQDRAKAIYLIEKGWTTEQIMKKFPKMKKMQIAAYKAHVTMGTYS